MMQNHTSKYGASDSQQKSSLHFLRCQCLPDDFSLTLLIRQTLRKVLSPSMEYFLGTFWLANQPPFTFTHLSLEMSSHMGD